MKDRLKVGSRVSCVIEGIFPNFIHLSFRSAGVVYRGVLLNETCSTVKRVIPNNYYKEKKVLEPEVTQSLYDAVNTRDLDTKSKGLRSKKLKPTYIVLDDYIYKSDNDPPPIEHKPKKNDGSESSSPKDSKDSVGKSPIDSLFGLVESLDSSIGRPVIERQDESIDDPTTKQDVRKRTKSTAEDETANKNEKSSSKTIEKQPSKSAVKSSNKAPSEKQATPSSKQSTSSKSLKPPLVKETSPQDSDSSDSIIKIPLAGHKIQDIDLKNSVETLGLSSPRSPVKSPDLNTTTDGLKDISTPSPAKKLKKDSLSSSTDAKVTPDEKRRRKGKKLVYNPKQRNRKLKLSRETNKIQLTPEEIIKEGALPIVKIEKKKVQRKPAGQKRIDPIALALKNIKNREKTRRRQRMGIATRRALSTSPNDLLRKAERKGLKKKKKRVKTTEEKREEERLRREEEAKEEAMKLEKAKQKELKQQKRLSERSVTRSVAASQEDGVSTRNRKYTLGEKTAAKIVKKSRNIQSQRISAESRKKMTLPLTVTSSMNLSPIVKIVDHGSPPRNQTIAVSTTNTKSSSTITKPPSKNTSNTNEIDLTCHEQIVSPETFNSFPVQPKKNRRKPLHVFKSLPNPATTDPATDGIYTEYKDINQIEKTVSTQETPVTTNTTTSLSTATTTISTTSTSTIATSTSESELFGKPYKITISRMNRPTLIPRRYLHSDSLAPAYQTLVQQPIVNKPSPFKQLRKSTVNIVARRQNTESDNASTSSTVTSPTIDDVPSNGKDNENEENNKDFENEDGEKRDHVNKKSGKPKKRKKQAMFDFHDTLKPISRSNEDIRIGDIIWGKVMGYGWWPGKVVSKFYDGSESTIRRVFCTWLGSNTNSTMNIRDLELFLPNFEKRFDVKKNSNSYTKAVVEAQHSCRTKYGLK
ncbi:neurofilament heavy polypeptide-like [Clytia hemisphaerica]|uniref:PWWP domain-containing protein n=1 Tax=Clytia hemisphaerica TaxID=252671 RepID=A0A7M5VGA9_9CNID